MDPPDILFRCCSRHWCWCYLNRKRPGAVGVEFSLARQWGNTAILPIFSDIDVDFCFHVVYFPPTIFFITYQYKSTNNWVCKMRQMWNFCGDGKSVTTTMNNWTCARWESFCVAKKTKGSCSVFIQVSTHDFDPKRIGFTHNSSASQACWNNQHFTCLCSRNNQDQAPQQEQPFECGSCKKQGECENKVYLVLVIQNNMSVHLQVDSELGCKIFWHIEIS